MKISVRGMFKDDAITNGKPSEYDQFNLKWEYPLPFSKESDGDKYTHGSNTVSWRADNADEGSAHCDLPVRKPDYSYVRKSAGGALDSAGNITWTVDLNAGSHKFDMSNFRFTDSLSQNDGKHAYVGDLKVYRVENGQETLIDTVALDAHAHHFEYRFPHDAGMHQYRLVYHTKPEAPKVGRSVYRNWVADWTVWGNGVKPE